MTNTTNEATTDLQKPFTEGELRALLEQYPARPPTMGGSNVSHKDSYLDHYVVSAWEKKCSAILKRREDAAPTLAARVLELEDQNARLRNGIEGLANIIRDSIKESDGPDRVWLDGVAYEGPLVDHYFKILHAIQTTFDLLLNKKETP